MSIIPEKLKKQFTADVIVVIVIIAVVLGGLWFTRGKRGGWSIKGGNERIVGETRDNYENLYIYDGGSLELEDAELTMNPEYDNQLGIFVEGDSVLSLKDSEINSDDFQFFISAYGSEDKYPRIDVKNSTITYHAGIALYGRSKLVAENSTVEEVQLRDQARVELKDSAAYIVLFSDEDEEYDGLKTGEDVDLDIKSEEGWKLEAEDSEIWGFQIDMDSGDKVRIRNSDGIVLSLHVDDDELNDVELDLPVDKNPSKGKIDKLGFELEWEDTKIDMYNFYVQGENDVTVHNSLLNEVSVFDDGGFSAVNSTLYCNLCTVTTTGELYLENVKVAVDEDTVPTLLIMNTGRVEIVNSDIRELRVVLLDSADLILKNTKYDEDKFDNRDNGKIKVDGKVI